ncbi:hypothetical protein [Flavobacterium sp.]|uniref:hypothetical protein n=1 Tax=Flavobacterium sp. TaxID=239 RepID=UPI0037C0A368
MIVILLLAMTTMSFTEANSQPVENFELIEKANYNYGTSSFVEKRIFLSSFIWHIYRETVSATSTKEDGTKCEDDTIDPVLDEYNRCIKVIEKYSK